MKFIAIIPARYASTRFPGKPLADLGGKTMIERVYRQASKVLGDVWVATDDSRIEQHVRQFGGNVVLTSPDHKSGTDRCWEAYRHITASTGEKFDVVINIQGDEPFVDPRQISELMKQFDTPLTDIATLARIYPTDGSYDRLDDPNLVKLVIGDDGKALYFSRSVIPYIRGWSHEEWPSKTVYHTHVGMYAYTTEALQKIVSLPQSSLEIVESLEQLRWLQNGYTIRVGITELQTIGIDTPQDLEEARLYLASLSEV